MNSPLPIAGLILAGGQSRRMGRNKALLNLHGRTLIEHCLLRLQPQVAHLLVSTNTPLPVAANFPQLRDVLSDAGPLGGVLTGLLWMQQHTTDEWLLSVAVDTPFFPEGLGSRLSQARQAGEVIVSARSDAKVHPTCSLWHVSLTEDLSRYLKGEQQRRVMDFIAQHPHRCVDFPHTPADPFRNLNTPEDWERHGT